MNATVKSDDCCSLGGGHVGAGLAWQRMGKSLSGRLKPFYYPPISDVIAHKKLIKLVFIREDGDSLISHVLRANTSRQTDSGLNCCLNT